MIKNKDGTPYKLTSPNPLGKTQEVWKNDEKYILHNFKWEKALVALKELLPTFDEEVEEEVVELPPEPEKVDLSPIPDPEEPKPDKKVKKKLNEENIVIFHCLPSVIKYIKDEFYNEERPKFEYGEKFTFEGIVVQREDLAMVFWSNVDLSEKTIVYPSKYRTGIKYGELRWWEINERTEKAGGYLYACVPSGKQPDFSS